MAKSLGCGFLCQLPADFAYSLEQPVYCPREVGGTVGSDSTRDASWFLLLCVGNTGPAAAGGTAQGLGAGGRGSSGPQTMTCFDCNDLFCPWPSDTRCMSFPHQAIFHFSGRELQSISVLTLNYLESV